MDPVENKKQADSAVRAGSVSAAPANPSNPAASVVLGVPATPVAPAAPATSATPVAPTTPATPTPTVAPTMPTVAAQASATIPNPVPAQAVPAATSILANSATNINTPAHEINSLTPNPMQATTPRSAAGPQGPAPIQAPTLLFPEQQRQAINTSTEHGDIILNAGRPKKRPLALIIGIIVTAVIIVAAVVLALVGLTGDKGDTEADGSALTQEETIAAWNRFFNFIYSGAESTLPNIPSQDDAPLEFAFMASVPPSGQRLQEYYVAVNNLFDPLTASIGNHFPDLSNELTVIDENLATLTTISQVENLNLMGIIERYNQAIQEAGGLDASYDLSTVVQRVKDEINENYAILNTSDNASMQSYYTAITNYGVQVVDVLSPVYLRGCTSDGSLNVACVESIVQEMNPDLGVASDAVAITETLANSLEGAAMTINTTINRSEEAT